MYREIGLEKAQELFDEQKIDHYSKRMYSSNRFLNVAMFHKPITANLFTAIVIVGACVGCATVDDDTFRLQTYIVERAERSALFLTTETTRIRVDANGRAVTMKLAYVGSGKVRIERNGNQICIYGKMPILYIKDGLEDSIAVDGCAMMSKQDARCCDLAICNNFDKYH